MESSLSAMFRASSNETVRVNRRGFWPAVSLIGDEGAFPPVVRERNMGNSGSGGAPLELSNRDVGAGAVAASAVRGLSLDCRVTLFKSEVGVSGAIMLSA